VHYLRRQCQDLGLTKEELVHPNHTVPDLQRKGIFTVCVVPKVTSIDQGLKLNIQ